MTQNVYGPNFSFSFLSNRSRAVFELYFTFTVRSRVHRNGSHFQLSVQSGPRNNVVSYVAVRLSRQCVFRPSTARTTRETFSGEDHVPAHCSYGCRYFTSASQGRQHHVRDEPPDDDWHARVSGTLRLVHGFRRPHQVCRTESASLCRTGLTSNRISRTCLHTAGRRCNRMLFLFYLFSYDSTSFRFHLCMRCALRVMRYPLAGNEHVQKSIITIITKRSRKNAPRAK